MKNVVCPLLLSPQVEIPVPGGPQGTPEGNAKLIQYQGGERIDNNPVGR